MKWLGQYIQSFTARFRDDVYLEGLTTTTETDMIVVDSDGLLSKRAIDAITVDVSDFMTNGTDNYVLTATGADAMNAEANLTFDGSTLSIEAGSNETDNILFIDANSLTTGSAINIDIDDALANVGATKSLVKIDYDKAGVIEDGINHITTGLDINMADAATNEAFSRVTMTGAQIDIDSASTQGIITQKGLVLNVAADGVGDATAAYGIEMEIMDGGTDIIMRSSADSGDACSIKTTTHGATTIATTDDDGAAAHFEVAADGNIVLGSPGILDIDVVGASYWDTTFLRLTDPTTSSATQGGTIQLISNDATDALGDNHRLGKLGFYGTEDGSGTIRKGASIEAFADAAWSGTVNDTRLEFYTMDGDNGSELSLTLDSDLLATFAGGVTVTGTITGDVTGNADTATALATARTIGGTSFDGTGNITPANATLAAKCVVSDSSDGADFPVVFNDENSALLDDTGTLTYNPSDGKVTATGFVGALTGQADTVATIAGLAPNTATTQATQPNITSIGTDGQNLSILGDSLTMVNTSTNTPTVVLSNTTDDEYGPKLTFSNYRFNSGYQDGEDNDLLGQIDFYGMNDDPAIQAYAKIYSDIHDATDGEESGRLTLQVANHDGGLGSGLILTGGSADDTIDATLGLGATSVVTVPGQILAPNGGMGARHYGNTIKILPQDFMKNDDSSGNALNYKDAATGGIQIDNNSLEAIAFVAIPEGMKATHVDMYGTIAAAVVVIEDSISSNVAWTGGSAATDLAGGSGALNSQITLSASVDSTATNMLAIKVTLTATSQRIWGGTVTIAAI